MKLPDLYHSPAAQTWNIFDARKITTDLRLQADVVIVGSGAGGGTVAEIFSRAGRKVILVEEGALLSSRDFDLDELNSYPKLYQDGMTRSSRDNVMSILQGRTVGGSTTVNWTASFRTPSQTLSYWQDRFAWKQWNDEILRPWFERMERRLSISDWLAPNANNEVLKRGCESLGWTWKPIPRNVKGCWNLGYCGLGCPTNAKQSSLVTSIPAALERGAQLIHGLQADRFVLEGDRIRRLEAKSSPASPYRVEIEAPLFILAAGGIGSPAVLLRTEHLPDPYQRVGQGTFLHPSVFGFGIFDDKIAPFHGAPQSIYSDYFQWREGNDGRIGFKIEAVPMQPGFASVLMRGQGLELRRRMQELSNSSGLLSLLRDGFHPDSPGGRVSLRDDRTPVLDYELNSYLIDGARRAHLSMAEIFFAAGAKGVHLAHNDSAVYRSLEASKRAIDQFVYDPFRFRFGSAHVMGGCAMGPDPRRSVVNEKGQHHQLENLYVCDGSLFPSSIGANPQLSIYGFAAKIAHDIIGDGRLHFDPQYLSSDGQ